MADEEKPTLLPATDDELKDSLSFGLRFAGRRRLHIADDLMARIAAEHLVQHLQRSGYVVMKKRPAEAPSTSSHKHPHKD